ncbi:UDP-N-acetylmuramoylalanine--D-glutamate ligase [Paucidesulfovibrio gracilis DSM 16080]|uniref:UDP-N-acetylmuramoylalanine--D-glutamate ligase n=1 Tax=Paucidesulfovibrio gracilis DSM 16080 TaxID=1121449 RepID=A0A1T4W5Q9_9BACT|nr:UDP-N-acetylmuramoyl-L-alanine--D-glutamate ligase [Paucidesulfovibrio gracilis]SKA72375.1 UDP-N-acetylmuramoylalanine--D-glutamate ligase [Paucidesulfovibrio gracilis DSM 16080]
MNRLLEDIRNRELLQGRQTVVVGAGRSGRAASMLLEAMGARVLLVDSNPELTRADLDGLPKTVELEAGAHRPEQFRNAELVVLSPGVPVRRMADVLAHVPARKIVAELELASWFTEKPILAITGSNGKTTTTTLVGEMLRASGREVFVGGNIGTPLSEHLLEEKSADVMVLEVSSFQLQNVHLFHPRVAMLLNFSPNHLDYHADLEEYLTSKLNLFARMGGDDLAVLPRAMRDTLADRDFTNARKIWFGPEDEEAASFAAPHLPGEHNRSNIAAAWQMVRAMGVTPEQAQQALHTFHPLPHRQQPVAEVKGVNFVDDSKATTLDAVAAALRSCNGPVRLLLGGVFKGGDVRKELLPAMREHVVQVALFGAGREVFEPILKNEFPVTWHPDLEQAVRALHADAASGDVILLSPGTASFDLYKGYAARGDHFQRIARGLAKEMAGELP